MAGAYKRPHQKKPGGRWTAFWIDENGKRQYKAGFTDKAKTIELARKFESEARLIREGLIDPRDQSAKKANLRPMAEHIEAFRLYLVSRGNTLGYTNRVASTLGRLIESSGAGRLKDLRPERLQDALARLRAATSARTANYSLTALKSFLKFLAGSGRIAALPGWMSMLRPANERVGRKVGRRALTQGELERLYAAAEKGEPLTYYGSNKAKHDPFCVTGPERAALYRLAAATGLRANELRSLTAESLRLDGENPAVVVQAAYSKHRREDVQPISAADAQWLRGWVATREGKPLLHVPEKTAKMMRHDLAAASIPVKTAEGTVDFHALRHTYISGLIERGVDPKTVQELARHSTITLTIDRYSHTTEARKREAINGQNPQPPTREE